MITAMTGVPIGAPPLRDGAVFASYALHTSPAGLLWADAGTGPAVLSLHGGLGGWDQSAVLDRALFGPPTDRRALAVCRPGYPGSTRAGRGDPAAQADLCADLLDRAGVDRTIVAAISGGGPIALAFARRHPDRCRGLILVSACSGPMASPVPLAFRMLIAARRWPAVAAWAGRRMAAAPIRDPALRARLDRDDEAAALVAALRTGFAVDFAARLDGLVADIAMCRDAEAPPDRAIATPTLLIHAVDDPVVPFHLAETTAARIDGAELMALPDGGHMALFAHHREIVARVAAFRTRLDGPS